MKIKDIPKAEKLKRLNINVFELTSSNVLSPVVFIKTFQKDQINQLLYKDHYCLMNKLHNFDNNNCIHICRRSLITY